MGKIWLPANPPNSTHKEFEDVTSMVIVGANGSGKSRLGAWIDELEGQHGLRVHRVSAHRALMIPEYVQPRALEQAERLLFIGSEHPDHSIKQKRDIRWQNSPTGHFVNDFDVALSWLFAEHYKVTDEFREACRKTPGVAVALGESKRETTLRIWHELMPQRVLQIAENKITARKNDAPEYHGKEMSDGERVTLYLIAQCMAAPGNAIVVIDEPELHLHQAIQSRLWDQIEIARSDCVFVYITHDLAFAASRVAAKKIWVRSYDGMKHWDWHEVPPTEEFPERLTLQILGSRRQILFVEGDRSSLDLAVYRTLYPERLVIPRNSCRSVIESTTALCTLPQLHHTDAYGIIDRDHRGDDEIASYVEHRVYAPAVAEIENLFLLPDAVRAASIHLKRDPVADLADVEKFVFGELEKELAVQVNDRATFQVQQRLNSFPGVKDRKGGVAEFSRTVQEYLTTINPAEIHTASEVLFKAILASRDYAALLRHYNRKSLASRASRNLGLADGQYPQLVLRLLQSPDRTELRDRLRDQVAVIPKISG